MKIKTHELIELALDWAVTKWESMNRGIHEGYLAPDVFARHHRERDFNYSTRWSQGGPIIERERVRVLPWDRPVGAPMHGEWCAGTLGNAGLNGPTPLIAAMRSYVASMLGDEVDVPDVLCSTAGSTGGKSITARNTALQAS